MWQPIRKPHPEAASAAADLDNLKRKVDAGASRAITQYFFDIDTFMRLLDRARAAGIAVPIVPGILPVTNFAQVVRFSPPERRIRPRLARPQVRGARPGSPDAEAGRGDRRRPSRCRRLHDIGIRDFHFYTLNRADLSYAICHILGVRPREAGGRQGSAVTTALLGRVAAERILVLDGAMGTMIQACGLTEEDYRGERFADHGAELRGQQRFCSISPVPG